MKLKTTSFLFTGICLLTMASCQSPKDQLTKKWQVVSFEDNHGDSMANAYLKSVDTITVVDTMMMLNFGTSNLDSIKSMMREDVDKEKEQREESAKMTSLNFKKNGYVEISNGANIDSAKWELIDKNVILSISDPSGTPRADTFTIENISSNKLKFKLEQANRKVYLNLRPFKKEDSMVAIESYHKMMKAREQQMQQMQQMQQQMQQYPQQAPTN